MCDRIYAPHTAPECVGATSEGKSKREIIRCLKRYVAREIYAALTQTGDQKLARPLDIYRSITLQVASGAETRNLGGGAGGAVTRMTDARLVGRRGPCQ